MANSNGSDSDDEQQPPKRKQAEKEQPDGMIGSAVKYLKMGFLPADQRAEAEKKYEADQKHKRRMNGDYSN